MSKKTQEQFENEVKEKYNGKISVIGGYTGYYNLVDVFCNKHNIQFSKNANSILNQKECCPECIKENSETYHKQSRNKVAYTTKKYIEDLEQRGTTVEPLEEYKGYKIKIWHQCKNCGNHLLLTPYKVKDYTRQNLALCQECDGSRLHVGKNDLWTTHLEVAKLLLNPEDGYKVTAGGSQRLDWKCPDCGCVIRQKIVHNVVRFGLSCTLCRNTRSIGHRLVNSLLNELNVPYVCEKTFKWSNKKFYDVYVESASCVIEVDGIQHSEECGLNKLGNTTLEEQIENDLYKENLAKENGITHYIHIDAKQSSIEYIVNSIKTNKSFNRIFHLSHVHWKNVIKNALDSDVCKIRDLFNSGKSVSEIVEIMHYSDTVVRRKLHDLTQFGFCNYGGLDEKNKEVVCLNTREVFVNLNAAGEKYNIDPNGISWCCKGLRNRQTAGKLPDGTKLMWLFKEDYDKKTEEEIDALLQSVKKKKVGAVRVICVNTKEIFSSIKDAQKKYPDAKSISDCCRNICYFSGTDCYGNKLQWMYYEDYIKLYGELDLEESVA